MRQLSPGPHCRGLGASSGRQGRGAAPTSTAWGTRLSCPLLTVLAPNPVLCKRFTAKQVTNLLHTHPKHTVHPKPRTPTPNCPCPIHLPFWGGCRAAAPACCAEGGWLRPLSGVQTTVCSPFPLTGCKLHGETPRWGTGWPHRGEKLWRMLVLSSCYKYGWGCATNPWRQPSLWAWPHQSSHPRQPWPPRAEPLAQDGVLGPDSSSRSRPKAPPQSLAHPAPPGSEQSSKETEPTSTFPSLARSGATQTQLRWVSEENPMAPSSSVPPGPARPQEKPRPAALCVQPQGSALCTAGERPDSGKKRGSMSGWGTSEGNHLPPSRGQIQQCGVGNLPSMLLFFVWFFFQTCSTTDCSTPPSHLFLPDMLFNFFSFFLRAEMRNSFNF